MKRFFVFALFLFFMVSGVFAMDMVIGGGGLFGFNNEHYKSYYDEGPLYYFNDNKCSVFGGFAFFGLNRFMEASIAVYGCNNDSKQTWYLENGSIDDIDTEGYPGSYVGVSLSLKYPFTLSERFVIFPAVGADVQNNSGGLDLWLRGGVGLDLFFTQRFFLRAQALYGYGFLLLYKGDLNEGTETDPTHGPLFKLGFGRMF